MINVLGTYECKADVKGRVMLPAALKKQLKNVLGRIVKNGYCIFIIKKKVTNGLISLKISLEELTMLLKIIGTQV